MFRESRESFQIRSKILGLFDAVFGSQQVIQKKGVPLEIAGG
jgi:hypothetical protein